MERIPLERFPSLQLYDGFFNNASARPLTVAARTSLALEHRADPPRLLKPRFTSLSTVDAPLQRNK
jgi:hypothetical protein